MKAFTYWIARCKDDHECYSIIGRTKRAVMRQLAERSDQGSFEPVEKRVIRYTGLFDFFNLVTGEGGGRNIGELVK